MLILLPSSEGKAAPRRRGRRVDLASLSDPILTPTRERILNALVAVSARPDALTVLGAPLGAAGDVSRNVDLVADHRRWELLDLGRRGFALDVVEPAMVGPAP